MTCASLKQCPHEILQELIYLSPLVLILSLKQKPNKGEKLDGMSS